MVGQEQLQKFQENMGKIMKDPFQVVMRQTKLPISLLSEKAKVVYTSKIVVFEPTLISYSLCFCYLDLLLCKPFRPFLPCIFPAGNPFEAYCFVDTM